MAIKIQHTDTGILTRLQNGLKPDVIDPIIEKVALKTEAQLKEATPKKWFGQVRRSWQTRKGGAGIRIVTNTNKIMLFLEEGTRDHGPVRAKALFIPLTKRAITATAGFHNYVSAVSVGGNASKGVHGPASKSGRGIEILTGGGRTKVKKVTLIYGQDYILAKRVRGIKPMKIVEKQRGKTREMLSTEFKAHIKKLINA